LAIQSADASYVLRNLRRLLKEQEKELGREKRTTLSEAIAYFERS